MTISNNAQNFSLRAQLRELNRLDPDQVDFEYLKAAYSSLLEGTQLILGMTPSAELFFRVRLNPPQKPETTAELGAPAAEVVTGFQMCNEPGKPTLYTSSKRITALRECRVNEGDRVYLTQWIARKPVPINRLLEKVDEFETDNNFSNRDNAIYAHIDTIFNRRIHADFSSDYKFSAAIASLLTNNFNENTRNDVRNDRTVGLRYPSVLDLRGSYNTAFHAEFAKERLFPMHCMEATVGKTDGSQLTLEILDNALDFDEGRIRWTGNPILVPALRLARGAVAWRYNGEKWLPEVRADKMTRSDLSALLME